MVSPEAVIRDRTEAGSHGFVRLRATDGNAIRQFQTLNSSYRDSYRPFVA